MTDWVPTMLNEINLRLEAFEGPFDLLFHLIDKNEIDIYDIPIAELTNQYIDYIRTFPEKDMESMSEFVLMASTLLEIKSKMLLPKTAAISEEEDIDPRAALVEKLIEYKRFKSVIGLLQEKQSLADRVYFKEADPTLAGLFVHYAPPDFHELLDGISPELLYQAFEEALNRRELKTDKVRSSFRSVSRDLYTIEEKIEHLQNLLTLYGKVDFFHIFSSSSGKSEKIVTFLALLELIKMKQVVITQNRLFDSIMIQPWKDDSYDDTRN